MKKEISRTVPDGKAGEYVVSVKRIVDFIDNFTDFMYHNIGNAVKCCSEDNEVSDLNAFLTSLRKEIADFQTEVTSLREKFDI